MQYQPGTVIGDRYRIERLLGFGGMAQVYLAQDTNDDSFQVALKVFQASTAHSAEARERFRTEINAAYRVPHPNVIQVYEFFDENQTFAFAMEYACGGDLYHFVKENSFSPEKVEELIYQVAHGLKAIHEQGVIHRDLKPENIMLSEHNQVFKISDFGVARLLGRSAPTNSSHVVGTPRYVSPEYVSHGQCDHRSDIFALGFLAFELLAGRGPYPDHQGDVLSRDRYQQLLRRNLPREYLKRYRSLALIVERCLCVSPEQRYQSADELIHDLELVRAGLQLSEATLELESEIKRFHNRDTARILKVAGVDLRDFSWVGLLDVFLGVLLLVMMIYLY